jgi:hypothetical protein
VDKSVGAFRAIERWCGKEPDLGSNRLQMLWEVNGPSGVPFDPAGAELLIDILDEEFSDRPMLLRAVDILDLTVDGLIDAIPDGAADISMEAAPTPRAASPLVVTLSDDSIERLASRLTAHLAPHLASQEKKPQEKKPPKKTKKGR